MRKLAQLLGLVAVAAIAFEGTIRIEDRIRFGMPIWSPVRDQSDLIVRDGEGVHGRANAQWRKWRMNNVGTRGPDINATKEPRTTRVVVLGASETFGLYESPGREYPRQLEDSLRAEQLGCPAGAKQVEVLNAAIPGMSLPTFTQDLRLRLRKLAPDIVVVYPTPAQYLDLGIPQAPPPNAKIDDRLRPEWAAHPRGIEHLRNGLKSMLPGPFATWVRQRDIGLARRRRAGIPPFTSVPPERLAAFERDLRTLVGAIRDVGAQAVLMTHGNKFAAGQAVDRDLLTMWQRFYPLADGEVLLAFDSAGAARTAVVAADSGGVLVDLNRDLPANRERLFADYVHFTDAGAGFVAGRLSPAIKPLLCEP